MRVWIGTAIVGIAVLGVTSCSSSKGQGSGGGDSSPAASPSTSASESTSASDSPPGSSDSPSTAPIEASSSAPGTNVAVCQTSALQLTQGLVDGTAGSYYVTYYLQNGGSAACTLTGFPGFALLDAQGAIIQRPAERNGAPYSTVTLSADGRVKFIVRTLDPSINGTGCSATWHTAEVQVYPPNQTAPLRQPSTLQACDLSVGPVQSVA
jgi:hypothetical protein